MTGAELAGEGAPGDGQSSDEYLTFSAGGERCALLLREVDEIVEFHGATRVPRAPEAVLGVFNLRGSVVPVLDLAHRLGLPPKPGVRQSLIVTRLRDADDSSQIALLVDAVEGIAALAQRAIQPPPVRGTSVSAGYLRGVAQTTALLYLLDPERVLRFADAPGSDASGAQA